MDEGDSNFQIGKCITNFEIAIIAIDVGAAVGKRKINSIANPVAVRRLNKYIKDILDAVTPCGNLSHTVSNRNI